MRRRRGLRAKRSVAWLPGLSGYDGTAGTFSRLITLAALPGAANIFAAVVQMTLDADLALHGGEDAVLIRTVGRLGFMEGRRNAGAGLAAAGFQMRVALLASDARFDGASGALVGTQFNLLASEGMGIDDIMQMTDVIVPITAIGGAGAGFELATGTMQTWLDWDVKAKRKVQANKHVFLWFQTVCAAGTTGADFRLLGGLRMLMMRPR